MSGRAFGAPARARTAPRGHYFGRPNEASKFVALTSGRFSQAFKRLGILIVIAIAFVLGLVGTIYLSLRSPEIQVPEVVNKTYLDGEAQLERAGLDIRERAKRYKPDVAPGVILDQSPRAGEVVKAGQTVAVVVSRAPREGEQALAEELAAEKRAAEGDGESKGTAANAPAESPSNRNTNANENRERRPRNANANRNANSNRQNSNNANRNANANRGANANRPGNANSRNANSAGNRNANQSRPAGGNANRRPTP